MSQVDLSALREYAKQHVDMAALCEYARRFSGLNARHISLLHDLYEEVRPSLQQVTDHFYARLQTIPQTVTFLEGHRIENLKQTHLAWLHELFNTDFEEAYTRKLYRVGDMHVKVKLPVEFMAGAVAVIQAELAHLFSKRYRHDAETLLDAINALNAATAFSLLVMQKSYHAFTLVAQLESFLLITGISHSLLENLHAETLGQMGLADISARTGRLHGSPRRPTWGGTLRLTKALGPCYRPRTPRRGTVAASAACPANKVKTAAAAILRPLRLCM